MKFSRYVAEANGASLQASVFLSRSTADDEHIDRVVLFENLVQPSTLTITTRLFQSLQT